MGWHTGFQPYVPVAQRRAKAAQEVAKRAKSGKSVAPVVIAGRAIAATFWGKAWCENLEGYSDFENRLPRGRSYVRNGSVVDLKLDGGRVTALVSGSELYEVRIDITPLPKPQWVALKARCAGQIGTLVELLQGKLSKAVMERVTDRKEGLFPKPAEITMRCSCPDYAGMCKHVAAAMYGVGHRLDSSPELLFALRGVDQKELIEQAIPATPTRSKRGAPTISDGDLGDIFGIEIGETPLPAAKPKARAKPAAKKVAAKPKAVKKPAAKKVVAPTAVKKATAKKPAKPVPKKG